MPRTLPLALSALALPLFVSCGSIQKQNRPQVVLFSPGGNQVLPAFLGTVRVTYDEPITILNETSVRIRAVALGSDGDVPALIYPDALDPYSVLVRPAAGGYFVPGLQHHLVMQEGAVINSERHYALDEFGTYFTVGPAPSIFVTSNDGSAYELAPDTGIQLSTTAPPLGYTARDLIGSSTRLWVWLDPLGVGPTLLGTFHPGDASMSIVPLTGETGTRRGAGFALSTDARVLYATTEDLGPGRVLLHRIDTLAAAEIPGALVLATPLPPGARGYTPATDPQHERIYVAQDDGLGGGWISSIQVFPFVQLDLVPGPGIDPIALPSGGGPLSYSPLGDNGRIFALLQAQPYAGCTLINPFGFDSQTAYETLDQGVPSAGVPTPDGAWYVQGLAGYAGNFGLVRSEPLDLGQGFVIEIIDDVGGVPQGSDRVGALLVNPATGNLLVFADDGTKTILCSFDILFEPVLQIDLDPLQPGIQGISLSTSVPGVVTSATTLYGISP